MARNRSPPPTKKVGATPAPSATPAAASHPTAPASNTPAPASHTPAAPASHTPAAPASHTPAAPASHPSPATPHQPTQVMQQPSAAGSGLMGTVAATMMGSMAGNALSHAMFGGHSSEPATSKEATPQTTNPGDPCKVQFETYTKCMENSPQCQWAWDEVSKCRATHGL